MTDRVVGMTNTAINIHTTKESLPDFRIVNFDSFTTLEIKSGPSSVIFHLAKGVTLSDILGAVCQAEVKEV